MNKYLQIKHSPTKMPNTIPSFELQLPHLLYLLKCATVSGSDPESEIDLLSCADVIYEKRGDVHGVSYCDLSNSCGWTPVVGRRKKKTPLPEHVLRRFPPYCRAELQRVTSDSESSGPDEPFISLKVHPLSLLSTTTDQVFM